MRVLRVPPFNPAAAAQRNGRNGEYLSGEEPLLGAVLGAAVVRRVRLGGQARLTTRSVQ